jgi:broad specificity phosphatase PhoE
MPVYLYIIRHAQSTNNALADQSQRVMDPLLTELGVRQAALLAEHIAAGPSREPIWSGDGSARPADRRNGHGLRLERIFTSAMRRALLTAQPLGQALGVTPEVWVDLHEEGGMWLDHGYPTGVRGYPGITRRQLMAEFPTCRLANEVTEGGWWRGGHETEEEAHKRAIRVAQRLRGWPIPEERIAIITHGAFATQLLRVLLGGPAEWAVYYHLDNTSISLVRFNGDGSLALRYLNRVEHLPSDMIS